MNKPFLIILVASALIAGPASGAENTESLWSWLTTFSRSKGVKPVDHELYLDECGGCHFAYQPGLLPTESWEKLLSEEALANHFGDSAEMDAQDLGLISSYVFANAADKSFYKRSRKIVHATRDGDFPERITEVKYIRRIHHDIPDSLIKDNPDVVSRLVAKIDDWYPVKERKCVTSF
jgi:hypothetical protein